MIEYNKFINDIVFSNGGNINSLNLFLFIILALLFSLAIDVIYGELPGRIHPVVIYGSIINFFKNIFIKIKSRLSGLLLVLSTTLVSSVIIFLFYFIGKINLILLFIIFTILLSSSFSVNMLLQTAVDVKNDLNESLDKARQSVSYLVSRNTDELTESFIVSATIESLTENITDSYVAPIFYYFIFGIIILFYQINDSLYWLLLVPMLYRLYNTLDAMVGYENCPSPNSGYTMASTAGALDIKLVKKDTYVLGDENKEIEVEDIEKAVKLSKLAIILFTFTIILLLILMKVIL